VPRGRSLGPLLSRLTPGQLAGSAAPGAAAPGADGASVAELTGRLSSQARALVADELALAKAELTARARQAGAGAVLLAAAGLLGLSGWLVLLAAAVLGIAVALPAWAAALIVGGALVLLAAPLALLARRRLVAAAAPLTLTTESVRADVREVTRRVRP
jgi:hypothetical protein